MILQARPTPIDDGGVERKGCPRVGFTVSRRVGNAVERNRVRRRLREVAERVTAEPGTSEWGPLAVAVRLHARPRTALKIPAGAFRPIPRVQSAIVTLQFCKAPVVVRDPRLLDRVIRSIFSQRRKMAVNALRPLISQISSLSADTIFEKAGVDPEVRPGTLELAELAELSEVLADSKL